MSKQRRKHNSQNNGADPNNFNLNDMGNLFNNMNPNQLASMLNGIDMNQLSGILQNLGGRQSAGGNSASSKASPQSGNVRSIELLNAMKPLVDAEKSQLIDSIIQLYNITRIIKK